MGWWKVQGTNNVIGDEPLDALTEAVASVVMLYQSEHGRKPTAQEWEDLLTAVLGAEEPEEMVSDVRLIKGVRLDVD